MNWTYEEPTLEESRAWQDLQRRGYALNGVASFPEDRPVQKMVMLPDGRSMLYPSGRLGAFNVGILPGSVTHIEQPKNPHQRPI